ncbi:MAG: CHC2 zinc finger domain-containing protein [Alphaproteobacteria bacterium]|nr:CHC2 zinc finger domain-containing protein [Alphaproteobacteria bacterium]
MAFDELIEAFDVEDYLSEHTTLRRSGPTHHSANPCPLCGARKTKFYVNTSGSEKNGFWNSYCCHEQGNLVDLVLKVEGFSRLEALSLIKARVEGSDYDLLPLAETRPAEPEIRSVIEFPSPLWSAHETDVYTSPGRPMTLRDRGVTQAIIDRHMLKTTKRDTVYRAERRFDLDWRLVVPVKFAGNSDWAGWQARDMTGAAFHKYVFPAGDRSAETLYDMDGYLAHGGSTLIICEGVFQKWAFDRVGMETGSTVIAHSAVASFGKKLTKEQVALIVATPKIERVVLAWDLDAAGEVIETAQKLLGLKQVAVLNPPEDGRDFDEISTPELLACLARIEPFDFARMTERRTKLALAGV